MTIATWKRLSADCIEVSVDSIIAAGDVICPESGYYQKIHELHGVIWLVVGRHSTDVLFADFMNNAYLEYMMGKNAETEKDIMDLILSFKNEYLKEKCIELAFDNNTLLFVINGNVYLSEHMLYVDKQHQDFGAIGDELAVCAALGALHMNASSARAAEVAYRIAKNCRLPIVTKTWMRMRKDDDS